MNLGFKPFNFENFGFLKKNTTEKTRRKKEEALTLDDATRKRRHAKIILKSEVCMADQKM